MTTGKSLLPLIIGLVTAFAGWELIVRLFGVPEFVLPVPSAITGAIWSSRDTLCDALLVTLAESLGGFILGTLLGIALAVLLTLAPLLEKACMPLVVAVNSVPVVAYTPLALIWMGIGSASKVTMVVLAVGFIILLNMLHGLKRPEEAAVNLLRSFGAGSWRVMCTLRIPAAMPSLVNGLRVGIVRSMIVAIVTEMLGAYKGIGWIIYQATQQVDFLQVWAAIAASSVASMLLYALLIWADRKIVWWT